MLNATGTCSHSLALSDGRSNVGYASDCRRCMVGCAAGGLYVARSRCGARDVSSGHAAMLPQNGLAVVAAHQANPSAFTAQTPVIARLHGYRGVFSDRFIQRIGYITFLALPVRGMVVAMFNAAWGVWPVIGAA